MNILGFYSRYYLFLVTTYVNELYFNPPKKSPANRVSGFGPVSQVLDCGLAWLRISALSHGRYCSSLGLGFGVWGMI